MGFFYKYYLDGTQDVSSMFQIALEFGTFNSFTR